MSMARDSQQSKVYEAERIVYKMLDRAAAGQSTVKIHNSTIELPTTEMKFGNIAAVATYLEQLQRMSWYRAAFSDFGPVTVKPRKGNSKAEYFNGVISLHDSERFAEERWSMRESVVLHELAHHCNQGAVESHGADFCGVLVFLVANILGPEVAFILQHSLYQNGCRVANI